MGYGIDIGASAVKAVAVRRTLGGFRVVSAARKRLGKTASPEEAKAAAGKILRDTLAAGGAAAGIVGLSGRDINLRVVQQPNTSTVNYRQMMFYEVDQARGQAGDLYADYCTLREPDSYFPQFLAMVGIGKSAYVDERLAMAKSAGVDVRDAVPNSFALFAAYKHAYGTEGGTVLLLDIGAEAMELVLVRGGRLIFARNVSQGARVFDTTIANMAGLTADEAEARKIQYGSLAPPVDDADAREEEIRPAIRTAAGQLAGVITSSIQYARTQLNDKELGVDKMYLSGGGARLKGLPEYLQSALKFTVEVLDPFKHVDAKGMRDVPEFSELPTDLACPLGLAELSATTTGATTLSILPEAMKKRRAFYQGGLFLVMGGVALAAAMLVATVVAFARKAGHASALADFNERTKDITERIDRMQKIEAQQREAASKVELLLAQGKSGRGLLDVYAKLRRTLPEGITVRGLAFFDLAERSRDSVPHKRCLFHYPGHGMVVGEVVKDDPDGTITLRSEEKFNKADMEGLVLWDAPSLAIAVEGEVDENIPGGAGNALAAVKEQLADPSRGVVAEIDSMEHSKDKPGWRNFKIVIRFE